MRLATIAAVVALECGIVSGQTPTFSAKTEAVRIDVLTTENGQPIAGLQAQDFEVRDNGVLQQVNLLSFDQIPLRVVLVLDASASVAGQRLADLQDAARTVLSKLRAEDSAGLVTFNAIVSRGSDVTADRAKLSSAVAAVKPAGGTALVDATYAGIALAGTDSSRTLMIVFSDGLDISSWLTPESVVRAARQSDVVTYAVTVGGKALPRLRERAQYEQAMRRVLDSAQFLRDLAQATGGQVFDRDSTRDLNAAFASVIEEFRHRYLISYVPRGVAKDGWHKVEVRVKGRRDANIKARPGYQAG